MLKVPLEHRALVGKIFKEKRLENKLSLRDLSEKVQIDPGNLSRIENGKASVSYEKLCSLALILDAPEVFTASGLAMPDSFVEKQIKPEPLYKDKEHQPILKDPFEDFNKLKPLPGTIDFDIELTNELLTEVGEILNLSQSFFRYNPILRQLISDHISLSANAYYRGEEMYKKMCVSIMRSDNSVKNEAFIFSEAVKKYSSEQGFWLGFLQGIHSSQWSLEKEIENNGLFWVLVGFIQDPQDILLVDKVYNFLKDRSPAEKEKITKAIKKFFELYELILE